MTDNQTVEPVVDAPAEGQAPEAGIEGVVETPVESPEQGTDNVLQSQTEAELDKQAEESLFETLAKTKGWQSPEDMAAAYKEAEAELTRKSQAAKKSQEDLEAMEAVLNGLVLGELNPDTIMEDEYNQQFQTPQNAPQSNNNEVREIRARLDVQTVANKYDDFAELQPIMSEILKETPNKTIFEGVKGVELLRRMAKAEYVEQELSKAKEDGKKEVTLKEIEKARASVADGTKAKQQPKQRISRETIAQNAAIPGWYEEHRDEILNLEKQGLL